MNKGLFLSLYLILFLSTYVTRYIVIMHGGTIGYGYSVGTVAMPGDIHWLGSAEKILLVIYAIMTLMTYQYGKRIDRRYLWIFPLVAGLFDVFLIFVVFVPTVLNLIGLIIGATASSTSCRHE